LRVWELGCHACKWNLQVQIEVVDTGKRGSSPTHIYFFFILLRSTSKMEISTFDETLIFWRNLCG
jgi:hypothetical protein